MRRLRFGFQVFCGSFRARVYVCLASFVARSAARIRNIVAFIK